MYERLLIEEDPLPSFYRLLLKLRGLKVLFHTSFCLGVKKKKRCVTNMIRTYLSFCHFLNCC